MVAALVPPVTQESLQLSRLERMGCVVERKTCSFPPFFDSLPLGFSTLTYHQTNHVILNLIPDCPGLLFQYEHRETYCAAKLPSVIFPHILAVETVTNFTMWSSALESED